MEVGGFTIFLIWFCVLGNLTTTLGSRVTITKRDAYFAGHVYERLPGIGWLHCALACEKQPRTCVSYNFNTQNGDCELSRSGVQKTCDLNDILVFAPGVIFQQLRVRSREIQLLLLYSLYTFSKVISVLSGVGKKKEKNVMHVWQLRESKIDRQPSKTLIRNQHLTLTNVCVFKKIWFEDKISRKVNCPFLEKSGVLWKSVNRNKAT